MNRGVAALIVVVLTASAAEPAARDIASKVPCSRIHSAIARYGLEAARSMARAYYGATAEQIAAAEARCRVKTYNKGAGL